MSDEQNEPGPSGVHFTEFPDNVQPFQRLRTDEEKAAAHKAMIRAALEAVVRQVEIARAAGFYTEFSLGPGPYGAYSLQSLNLVKRF